MDGLGSDQLMQGWAVSHTFTNHAPTYQATHAPSRNFLENYLSKYSFADNMRCDDKAPTLYLNTSSLLE